MNEYFEKIIYQAEQGKRIFKNFFEINRLNIKDAFLLVLTNDEECINYGLKYLKDFIELYNKRDVYVLLSNVSYAEAFSNEGGKVKICSKDELQSLAAYLDMFRRKEVRETRIIFLTEKDGYGIFVEELLKRKEFSLEEYVAISLYQLDKIRRKCHE